MINKSFVAATVVAISGVSAVEAASLNLTLDPDTLLTMSASDELVYDTLFGFGLDFVPTATFGTEAGDALDGVALASAVSITTANTGSGIPPWTINDEISISGTGGLSFTGELNSYGFTYDAAQGGDTIELLYDVAATNGSDIGSLANGLLLTFFGEFGSDPFGTGIGSFASGAAVTATIQAVGVDAPVPLPMTGVLLGGALAGFAAVRRRA